ncbi:MAG TPA: hypothetical protein DHW42_00770 [Candidatus Marinimicrobia bacterium]|nr:hypothetical protein [Candidatus Neomarinimicrobiota bacterium]
MCKKVAIQNQIKSDLLFYGINLNQSARYWSESFVQQLWSIEFDDPDYTQVFQIILAKYEEICQEIKEVTTFIKKWRNPVYSV